MSKLDDYFIFKMQAKEAQFFWDEFMKSNPETFDSVPKEEEKKEEYRETPAPKKR